LNVNGGKAQYINIKLINDRKFCLK